MGRIGARYYLTLVGSAPRSLLTARIHPIAASVEGRSQVVSAQLVNHAPTIC